VAQLTAEYHYDANSYAGSDFEQANVLSGVWDVVPSLFFSSCQSRACDRFSIRQEQSSPSQLTLPSLLPA
jgi:hypothetical protein